MTRNTRCTQHGVSKKEVKAQKLQGRIDTVKRTIDELEKSPPALGDKWRAGMLNYYRHVLTELEALRGPTR